MQLFNLTSGYRCRGVRCVADAGFDAGAQDVE